MEEQAKETGKVDPEFGLDSSGIAGTGKEKKEKQEENGETKMEEGEIETKEENTKETKEKVSHGLIFVNICYKKKCCNDFVQCFL